jgi:hypothetical protein
MKNLTVQHKAAQNIMAKASPVIAAIKSLETVPEFDMIALPLKEPLTAKHDVLETAMVSAAAVVACQDPSACPPLPDVKDVTDAIAGAKTSIALITGLLAAIARAHR